MSDLLKSVIQDLINDRTEQAQVTIHDYIVAKTQQIAGLAEAKTGEFVVIKVGFTSMNNDGDDKEDFCYAVIKASGSSDTKQLMDHAKEANFEDGVLDMNHVVQNVTGGNYAPGSAYFVSAKVAAEMPDGRKYFSADAGDFLAA